MNVQGLTAEVQIYNCLRQKVIDQYLDLDDETIWDTWRNHRPPRDDSGGDPLGASG